MRALAFKFGWEAPPISFVTTTATSDVSMAFPDTASHNRDCSSAFLMCPEADLGLISERSLEGQHEGVPESRSLHSDLSGGHIPYILQADVFNRDLAAWINGI